jgi:hypothetical protein
MAASEIANNTMPSETNMAEYPADAYSPSGTLWWQLEFWPGKKKSKFGAEPKLASWLNFNAKVGDVFTLRQLREVLGDSAGPNTHEHFNRRLRNLRKYGWSFHSNRDSVELRPDEYRLAEIGTPIWLGKSKFGKKATSDKIRREVFERDGHRCLICGIGAGEYYPDQPTKKARLTLGHFVADSLRGSNDAANLRTECSRCNEPAKEVVARSESAAEILPKIRNLSKAEKIRLLSWIERGQRERDTVDRLFDQYRSLPSSQRDEIRVNLQQTLKQANG